MAGTRTPLWAPTPGVPILARVLSYTFACLMLLTLGLTCGMQRPLSTPGAPRAWYRFSSKIGYAISYPVGWMKLEGKLREGTSVGGIPQKAYTIDRFSPGGGIIVRICACKPAGSAQEFYRALDTENAEDLVSDLMHVPSYQPDSAFVPGTQHLFTTSVQMDDPEVPFRSQAVVLEGVWEVVMLGDKVFLIAAICPKVGWAEMQTIVSQMVSSIAAT
jgi:hypothetical protein